MALFRIIQTTIIAEALNEDTETSSNSNEQLNRILAH